MSLQLPKGGDPSPKGSNGSASEPWGLKSLLSQLGLQTSSEDSTLLERAEDDSTTPLLKIDIDANGFLCLNTAGLEQVLQTLARVLTGQSSQLQQLFSESETLHGRSHALEEGSLDMSKRLHETAESGRLMSYQLGELYKSVKDQNGVIPSTAAERNRRREPAAGGDAKDVASRRMGTNASANVAFGAGQDVTRLDLAAALKELEDNVSDCLMQGDEVLREQLAELSQRLDALEQAKEEGDEDVSDKSEEGVDLDEMDVRVAMVRDEIMGVKADLGSLQKTLKESLSLKADKKELEDLRKTSDLMLAESRRAQAVLAEANKGMEKFDICLQEVEASKKQRQELVGLFRNECHEIRVWTTSSLGELRTSLVDKIEQGNVTPQIDDFKRELRDNLARFLEVSERCQIDTRRKASQSDLQKLQEELDTLRRTYSNRKQLVMGTRCLGCARPLDSSRATEASCIDLARQKQEECMLHDVERILADQSPDMKLVAARIGSPYQPTNVSVPGSPGLASLRLDSSRPHTTTCSRRQGTGGNPPTSARGDAEMPERFPPREALPVVRVSGQQTKSTFPSDPRVRGSTMRDALGI